MRWPHQCPTQCYSFHLVDVFDLKCRQHEAELRQSREECWARQQEVAAAREKLAHLKTTLEGRRKDVVSYKVTKLDVVQHKFVVAHNLWLSNLWLSTTHGCLLWLVRAGTHHKQHTGVMNVRVLVCPQQRKMEQDSVNDSLRDVLIGLSC